MLIPTLTTEVPGNFLTAALWNGTVIGGLQAAQNPVLFKGYATTAQTVSLTTSVATPILLDSEVFDTDGGHSTTTNTSRYVCQTAGVFMCFGGGVFATTQTTGQRGAEILVNGASQVGNMGQIVGSGTTASVSTLNIVRLSVGDYVELGMWQTSSGALATSPTTRVGPSLTVVRISN